MWPPETLRWSNVLPARHWHAPGTQPKKSPMSSFDPDNPDVPLAELFRAYPETASAFLRHRMICPGCPIAPFHTVIDACLEYGLEEEEFRKELEALSRFASPRPR